jgi:hypothetical protein
MVYLTSVISGSLADKCGPKRSFYADVSDTLCMEYF